MRRAILAFFGLATLISAIAVGIVVHPTSAAAATWPVYGQGARGAEVAAIQHLLNAHGIGTGVDGVYGPQTAASVQAFQRSAGLGTDGVVGSQTWPRLIITVRQGDSGEAVKAAQEVLRKFAPELAVDGAFGPATATVTRNFQTILQLGVDGIIGPNTWNALVSLSPGGGGGGGGYALPLAHDALPRGEYDDPHHDYPAIDLPVGTGTNAYAITGGTISYVGGSCGNGLSIAGNDGASYKYCHLNDRAVGPGAVVSAGQFLGHTGATGNVTGPHLHMEFFAAGAMRCPGPMLLAIYDGVPPPSPGSLPTSGCIG